MKGKEPPFLPNFLLNPEKVGLFLGLWSWYNNITCLPIYFSGHLGYA